MKIATTLLTLVCFAVLRATPATSSVAALRGQPQGEREATVADPQEEEDFTDPSSDEAGEELTTKHNHYYPGGGHGGHNHYYKKIQVYVYGYKKYWCWDAGSPHGYLIPYAKSCYDSNGSQKWQYDPLTGQIRNKAHGKCVTYDYKGEIKYNYKYKYTPLYLAKCNKSWPNQKFKHYKKHFVSQYNGLCIDLYRDSKKYYFYLNKCDRYYKDHDQLHKLIAY